MPRISRKDERAGLKVQKRGSTYVAKYDAGMALDIIEKVAEGKTLKSILAQDGYPSYATFHKWMTASSELLEAYHRAKELSASALDDEALELARDLVAPGRKVTQTRVSAANAAMGQYRWSASRRNPKEYGQTNNLGVVVPIQINTSLDLGDNDGNATQDLPRQDNIYTIEAQTIAPEAGDEADTLIKVPEKVDPPLPRNKGGRPPGKGKWKSPRRTKQTATIYAKRKAQAKK